MVIFPNCKINLGLNVINKRDDGFHNLETIFYPIPIHDALEIVRNNDDIFHSPVQFSQTGFEINESAENNLCVKAYHLLKNDFPHLPHIKMHLHKAIPLGAGLGGGSSDAAFTLTLLNKKFSLQISNDQLMHYALKLGSDCPFFISNLPCFATGRGEQLTPIQVNITGYTLLLINPGVHINTAWAYAQIIPQQPTKSLKQIIQQPVETWKEELKNDFENPVLYFHPQLLTIKQQLYKMGAVYAAMSGSGSTFFGIFRPTQKIEVTNLPKEYFVKEIILK